MRKKKERVKKYIARNQKRAEKDRLAAAWRNIFVKAGILKKER